MIGLPGRPDSFGPGDFRAAFDVSRETLDRLEIYATLLGKWQPRINLVAPSTVSELWWRHLADSAQVAALLPKEMKDAPPIVADIGSGAGFPGLVLALMRPMFHVKLIESNLKKAAFLQEVIAQTGAGNIAIIRDRAERQKNWTADIVTARACAALGALLAITEGLRGPNTVCHFLKGASAEGELTRAREDWNMRVQTTPSVTNPDSVILTISEVSRVR